MSESALDAEGLYETFMASQGPDQNGMAFDLQRVRHAEVILESLKKVLGYCKSLPDLDRAEFYYKLDVELMQLDGTHHARITLLSEWLGLGFITHADRYGLHNQLAELLDQQEVIWLFAGRSVDHYATAETYLP